MRGNVMFTGLSQFVQLNTLCRLVVTVASLFVTRRNQPARDALGWNGDCIRDRHAAPQEMPNAQHS
jgi:hypothetical protein